MLPFSNVSIVEKLLFQMNTSSCNFATSIKFEFSGFVGGKVEDRERKREDRKVVASSEVSNFAQRRTLF